jgi:hypothetical protein
LSHLRLRAQPSIRAYYPVVIDNDCGVWSAFGNHYRSAPYFVDADDIIRGHCFGEGRYEQTERFIQQLLGVEREFVARKRPSRTAGRLISGEYAW